MNPTQITKQIEEYAEKVYLNDTTGENHVENIIHATNLKKILEYIPKESLSNPILEMGYGEGVMTDPLVAAGLEIEIIEGSKKLCEIASNKFKDRVKVYCAYFEDFTPIKKYEVVLALHVLEHVDNPTQVLKNVIKWMKPGGTIIAVVPNSESFHRQLAVMMGLQDALDDLSERDRMVGHQRVMNSNELRTTLLDAGFEITKEFGYFLKTVPNSMMKAWPPDLIKNLIYISEKIESRYLANIGIVATKPF